MEDSEATATLQVHGPGTYVLVVEDNLVAVVVTVAGRHLSLIHV